MFPFDDVIMVVNNPGPVVQLMSMFIFKIEKKYIYSFKHNDITILSQLSAHVQSRRLYGQSKKNDKNIGMFHCMW